MDSENFQKKLYFVNEQLKDLHSKLSSYEIQSRIPLENLSMMGKLNFLFSSIHVLLMFISFQPTCL